MVYSLNTILLYVYRNRSNSHNIATMIEFANQYHWSHEHTINWEIVRLIMSKSNSIFRILFYHTVCVYLHIYYWRKEGYIFGLLDVTNIFHFLYFVSFYLWDCFLFSKKKCCNKKAKIHIILCFCGIFGRGYSHFYIIIIYCFK